MFQVLHSGAGAGKTHALVKHYLGLCLARPDPGAYRCVLALTFTNKAAGEMKERVLRYLERIAEGAQGDPAIDDVTAHVRAVTGLDNDSVVERASAVLNHMLHHWGDVAISTIDAFTRRVVRPFARDLRLDHDLRMTTDQQHYLHRAVDDLVDQAGVEPTVTGLLTDACLRLLDEEAAWDPARPLHRLGGELLKERSIAPLMALRELDPARVRAIEAELDTAAGRFRNEVRSVGREAVKTVRDAGLQKSDLPHGGAVLNWFSKLADFDEGWPEAGAHARKPFETGVWHSAKAGPAARAAAGSISERLTALRERAEDLRAAGLRAYLVRRAVARELLTAYTLHALDERLEEAKRADGVAFFGDLTRRVAEVVVREPVPFIYERVGERYRHYLLDEFQDTSLLQWKCLLPLIDEALATDGSALLVGDAKQAIYRWRNGEVRLFRDLPHLFGGDPNDAEEARREATLVRSHAPIEPLATNHRSAATIVELNNRLFGELAAELPVDLSAVYANHSQLARSGADGLVELWAVPADLKGDEAAQAPLSFLSAALEQALADGYRPGDVAVLVRSRTQGERATRHLLAQGHRVVSPDGLSLSSDHRVNLIVDLLRWIHTADAAVAARCWQRLEAYFHTDPARPSDQPVLLSVGDPVAYVRGWLAAHGDPRLRTTLSAFIAELARALGVPPAADAMVSSLLDEAHAWGQEHGEDLAGFLDHWDNGGGDRGIAPPADGGAVQVMTVHKAKGLEFPVVIVPYGTGDTTSIRERFWISPGDVVPALPVALVQESRALRDEADLPELAEEEGLRSLDQLNLLYVAFTRAGQRLHAAVPARPRDRITAALRTVIEREDASGLWTMGRASVPSNVPEMEESIALRDVSSAPLPQKLTLLKEAPADWDPTVPGKDPRAFGLAVHAVLAHVTTAEDLPMALSRAHAAGELGAAADLGPALEALLRSPKLAPWFAPGLRVRREASLVTADGHALRPDRVVVDGPALRVLDIKTGAPSPSHHDQVANYMRLFRAMGHAQVEGALWYLPSDTIVPVAS